MLVLGHNANYSDGDYKGADIRQVRLSPEARRQGTYVIGTTGTGKTTLLLNLICQDMVKRGPGGYEGLCVLDPHGDFTEDILCRVPEERWDDVILFDPTDIEHPLGLNLFECNRQDPKERDLVVSTIIDTLHKLFVDSWGPRMEDLLRHSILSLLHHSEPTTLIHLMLVLVNYEHRQRLTAEARRQDAILRSYWEDQFPESYHDKYGRLKKPQEQIELVGSSLNKIGRFIANPVIRHIVGQEHSSFNFREVMDEGKILLVNLSKGDLGPDNSALLGAVIVNQLLIAALSRREIPPEKRRPFHLYVDEFQTFATKTFPELQSEARKYAIDTLVAHQYRNQLDLENLGSSLNVSNLVVLRVTGRDGLDLALQYDLTPPPPEVRFEPLRYPVNDTGTIFVEEKSEGTGSKLFQQVAGPSQLYSDVAMETANLLAQLPNYQAICRILKADEEPPVHLEQYRIDLAPPPRVDPDQCERATAYIKARARKRAAYTRREIAKRIEAYTGSTKDPDGTIPAEDIY